MYFIRITNCLRRRAGKMMASYTMVSPRGFLIWFRIAVRTNENLIGLKLSDV